MGMLDLLQSIDWQQESYPNSKDFIVLPFIALFFLTIRFFLDRFIFEVIISYPMFFFWLRMTHEGLNL